jgi:hypothetical protein
VLTRDVRKGARPTTVRRNDVRFTPQSGHSLLFCDIGHGDPNDDLRPALAKPVGHLRKMLASFAAQLFGRGALVER